MWLFDDIIKDQSSTTVAAPVTQTQSDDSLLIIDDSTTEAVAASMSDATSFIDLDTAPAVAPVESSADLIVFDDAPTIVAATEKNETVEMVAPTSETLVLSELLAKANEETEKQAPSFFAEETIAAPQTTPVAANIDDMFSLDMSTPAVPAKLEAKPLEDPNAILEASIMQLQSLSENHDLVRQGKEGKIADLNATIADLNKQVASLKKEITSINKEIDSIDTEKARVTDMIKLFQSQKAA